MMPRNTTTSWFDPSATLHTPLVPSTPAEVHAARVACARNAVDADECREFLAMLGIGAGS